MHVYATASHGHSFGLFINNEWVRPEGRSLYETREHVVKETVMTKPKLLKYIYRLEQTEVFSNAKFPAKKKHVLKLALTARNAFLGYKIIGAPKTFKNQPRPLLKPSSVNFSQNS
jgi:hypothetical protein